MTPEMMTWQMARSAFERKDYRDAIAHLDRLHADHPTDRQVLELRARAYFHTAALRKAEADARALVAADPTDAYAHLLLARTLERQGRHGEAVGTRRLLAVMSGDERLAETHEAFR